MATQTGYWIDRNSTDGYRIMNGEHEVALISGPMSASVALNTVETMDSFKWDGWSHRVVAQLRPPD